MTDTDMLTGQDLIQDINDCTPPNNGLAFWWLGQASVVVKTGDVVVYIDPYLSPDASRLLPALLRPEDVTNADIVLCTHDHRDHMDPGALPGIAVASPDAAIIVPAPCVASAEKMGVPRGRATGARPSEPLEMCGLTIRPVAAQHEFFDATPDGDFPYLGYVVEPEGASFYHTGDTLCYDGLLPRLRELSPSIAFLPINGRDAERYGRNCIGNMTYQEAVDLAGNLSLHTAVPIHHGMFAGNTEDPRLFADYIALKFPGVRCCLPEPGKRAEIAPT